LATHQRKTRRARTYRTQQRDNLGVYPYSPCFGFQSQSNIEYFWGDYRVYGQFIYRSAIHHFYYVFLFERGRFIYANDAHYGTKSLPIGSHEYY